MAKKQTRPRRKPRSAGTSAARLAAVQGLYEMEIAGASFDNVLMDHMHDRWSGLQGHTAGDELDRKKFGEVVKGVTVGKKRYDEMIANVLEKDRTIQGMDVLMLTILRAGLHELFAEPNVPAKVPALKPEQGGFKANFISPERMFEMDREWQNIFEELFMR